MADINTNAIRIEVLNDIDNELNQEFYRHVESLLASYTDITRAQVKLIIKESLVNTVKHMKQPDAKKECVFIKLPTGQRLRIPIHLTKRAV